ncbi:hypothetical protein Tco_1448666 [Tanacetum coccineum]
MADENVPAPAPTRSNDQILPFAAWVPIGKSNYFVSPPLGDAIMDFVNELGYTEVIHFVSRMAVNNLYQPWRAILSMINQCLTDKTSRHDRPRYPVLQMLWGIITSTNVDYAELIPTKKVRKDKPHVIPYCHFTKLIICHLGRIHNIHQRSASPFHLVEEGLRLGNLKFVSKGEVDELVDEPDEEPAQPEPKPEHQGDGEEYDVERAIQMSLELFHAEGHAHIVGVAIREPVAEATRPLPVVEGKDAETSAESDKTNSGGDNKILHITKELGEDVDKQVSMERALRDEFLAKKDKSRKRRRDNQDPPPPPPDSDPKEDRPITPEPDWFIPMNDLPEQENNWEMHSPNPIKILRKTSYFRILVIWDHSSLGFAKGLGRRNSASLIWKAQLSRHRLVPDVGRPLPLGGPPGQLKAAQYLNFGLEELVPSLWIESEREYDISDAYGISHWWFKRKELYITRHNAPSDRSKVRSHMRILSVVSLKSLERYGYTYLKEIVLRRADYKEYKSSENVWKICSLGLKVIRQNSISLNQIGITSDSVQKKDKHHSLQAKEQYIYKQCMIRRDDGETKVLRYQESQSFVGGRLRDVDYRLIQRTDDFLMLISVPTEMELELEQTQQGSSHEVSNIRVIPKYHSEDGNPARANIKQALGRFQDQERYEHVGPQDTRSQDGERPQVDDQRLDLADDLKEAHDHISSTITSHKTKITTSKY